MRRAYGAGRAFTLIEVLACLLLFTFGALAVVGLAFYGISLFGKAKSSVLGMETARTILADPQPMGMRDRQSTGSVVTGFLNGFYVRRTASFETPLASGTGTMRIATITAEVYLGDTGRHVATLRQRRPEFAP